MDSEDDLLLALSFFRHGQEQDEHKVNLAAYCLSLQITSSHLMQVEHQDDCSSDENAPGRGTTSRGFPKAPYMRILRKHRHHDILYEDSDSSLFDKIVHLSREDFYDLYEIARDELKKPMDVRKEIEVENDFTNARKWRLDLAEILLLFFETLVGSNEGGQGNIASAHNFGISPASVSSYFRRRVDTIE